MARTILLSGACGSGKSAVAKLGYPKLSEVFGKCATIGTDQVLEFVDPIWELPHDAIPDRGEMLFEQCAILTKSFFSHGFEAVLISGNALHTPEEIDLLLVPLLELGEVYHVTLDPSLEEIQRRVRERGDGNKTDEWLASHVSWMREKYGAWTAKIDNTHLTPEETLAEIARKVAAGEGRITVPFSVL